MTDCSLPTFDPLPLAQELIRCRSVTPADDGALALVEDFLRVRGFSCQRLPFGKGDERVDNLYARLGTVDPVFCFCGHTDVVPPGDEDAWTHPPFAAEVADGVLYGRGAVDMKGDIAAFVAGLDAFLQLRGRDFGGSISVLITGDEEGPSINGVAKLAPWMAEQGERFHGCIVGEPTSRKRLGDTIKNGRRGSLTGVLTVTGVQGHVAYPHLAENPLHKLTRLLDALIAAPLDSGTEAFEPSTLQITTIDTGNPASNVIPASVRAVFNSRFNDQHTGKSLERLIRTRLDAVRETYSLETTISAEPFLTPAGPFTDIVRTAIAETAGTEAELNTGGGTSDARFLFSYGPVVELGLVGSTIHQVDERVPVQELRDLAAVYRQVLESFFRANGAMGGGSAR